MANISILYCDHNDATSKHKQIVRSRWVNSFLFHCFLLVKLLFNSLFRVGKLLLVSLLGKLRLVSLFLVG